MTGSTTDEHTPGRYNAEFAVIWTIVGVSLAYGLYHAAKALLQLQRLSCFPPSGRSRVNWDPRPRVRAGR